MRKNFFKQLAFVLAATMVVGASAPAASAAAKPALDRKSKNLYLNNEEVGSTYDFNIKNKVKGSKYAWSSSDKTIATVNSKNGLVTGKKVGKVTITCKITLPTKKTQTLKATVNVKANATAVAIKNPVETIKIGENVYDFNRTLTESDATDKTAWFITDDTAGTTISSKGVVTTTKAGKFTLTAKTYQNLDEKAAENWTSVSDSITVNVVPTLTEVNQTHANKVNLVFDTDVSDIIKKEDLTITDNNSVKQVIKGLTFSSDGKIATVENYVDFKDKVVYKVTHGETSLELTASKGDVASVTVTPKVVQYGVSTKFDVNVFDANGIDVTTDDHLTAVDFDYDSAKGMIESFNSSDKYRIYMYDYDKSMSVQATYHTYKYENNQEVKFTSQPVTFTSVKEIKNTATEVRHTLTPTSDNADWDKLNKVIPAESTYNLYVKAKNNAGDDITQADFAYESTDSSILMVNKDSSDVVTVYGVKAGTAYVKATYGDTVQMLEVTVSEKSKVVSVVADNQTVTLYSTYPTDKVTVKLVAKDQYGKEVTYNEVPSINAASGNSRTVLNVTNGAADNEIDVEFNGATVTNSNAGSSRYEFTYSDGKKASITVNVVYGTSSAATKIEFDNRTITLDGALDTKNPAIKTTTLVPYIYNAKSQKMGIASGSSIVVKRNGTTLTAAKMAEYNVSVTQTATGVEFKAGAQTASGGAIAIAETGAYVIELTNTNIVAGKTFKTVANIQLNNTQPVPTAVRKEYDVAASNVAQVITDGLKVTLSGNELKYSDGDYTLIASECIVGSTKYSDGVNETVTSGQTVRLNNITIEYTIGTVTKQTIRQVINVNDSLVVK